MTATETTYNGWTNWETWSVNLWLRNDEGSYSDVRELTSQALAKAQQGHHYLTPEEHACRLLGDAILEYVESLEPMASILEGASMASDLLGAALGEVNWDEIAQYFLDD